DIRRLESVNSGLNARQQNWLAYQQTTQSSLTTSTSVKWEMKGLGGAILQFKNQYSLLCLGDNGSPVGGSPATQIPCNDADISQWWPLDPVPNHLGQYYAHHWGTPYYLDVAN